MILALGGASWPQTGSDGGWVNAVREGRHRRSRPSPPANCGYEVDWPPEFLAQAEGLPLKNVVVRAGDESVAGELLITKYGLEGGALYQLGRALRAMEQAGDRDRSEARVHRGATRRENAARAGTASARRKPRRAWRLSPAAVALLRLRAPFASGARTWPTLAKAYPLALRGPRPIEEAISTAGGVAGTNSTSSSC